MNPSSSFPKPPTAPDNFFPSGRFAKVPAEALGSLALEGPHAIGHAAFRVLVALCRFRGASGLVNPSQETVAAMTGLSRNNVSRATRDLAKRGWVVVRHEGGDPHKRVANYELLIPTPGMSPGVPPKPSKAQRRAAEAHANELAARPVLSQPRAPQAPALNSEPLDEVAWDLAELASVEAPASGGAAAGLLP